MWPCLSVYQYIKRPPVLMRRYSIQRYYLTLMKIPFLAVIMNMIKCVNGSKTKIVLWLFFYFLLLKISFDWMFWKKPDYPERKPSYSRIDLWIIKKLIFSRYQGFKVRFVELNWIEFLCLTPLSAIFQLYHGDRF